MTRSIYAQAIAHYGREEQLGMVAEECAELIAALSHYRRGRCGPAEVAEEIADVMITCEQAALLVGEGLVEEARAEKIERLKARLAAASGGGR